MSKFGTKEELVKAIESHFSSMQQGKMSLEDLEMLVEQSRELYERVLVLRYKAYEEKIFGDLSTEQVEAKEVLQATETHVTEAIVEQEILPQDESFEVEVEEKVLDIQVEGEPIFDFSLFDETPAENTLESTEDNLVDEIPDEVSIEDNDTEAEFEIQSETEFLEEEDELYANVEDEAVSLEEPTITQEETHAVEFTAPIHSFDEKATMEHHVESSESTFTPEPTKPVYESDQNDIFKDILKADDDSLSTRLMQSRLDTLIGAFGFNEKFQCIQVLFNGSSDDFNQALDVLDNLHTFQEAKEQLHYYVRLNNWDLQSEVTAEFVRKIERRFK